jgi:hypothetical protein
MVVSMLSGRAERYCSRVAAPCHPAPRARAEEAEYGRKAARE